MEFFFKTLGGQEYAAEESDYDMVRYIDASRPSEVKLIVPSTKAVIPKGWVRAVEDGQTRFVGYVSRKPSISGGKQTVECRGAEAQLWHRYFGRYGWQGKILSYDQIYTRLAHVFSSDPPYQDYDRFGMKGSIGMLWYANSKLSPGKYWRQHYLPWPSATYDRWESHGPLYLQDYDYWIFRIPGAGKKSRFGTSNIYLNGSLLTEQASFAALKASSDMGICRDDEDLWIKIVDAEGVYIGEQNNIIFADKAIDTLIRCGTIDDSDDWIRGNIDVQHTDLIGETICKIASIHDLNIRWGYKDWLCYCSALGDFEDDGVFEIRSQECDKIEYETNSDYAPDALIGLGFGSKEVRQTHSIIDMRPGAAFLEKNFEVSNGFSDYHGNMPDLLTAEWKLLQNTDIIKVTSRNYDYLLPGHLVDLLVEGEQPRNLQVAKIQFKKGKSTAITIGSRDSDIIDAMEALKEASSVYEDQQFCEWGTLTSVSGNITIGDLDHADTGFTTGSFTLPAWNADMKMRLVLNVGISPPANTYINKVYCTFWVCMHSSTSGIDNHVVTNGGTQWYLLGDTVNGIDVTDWANWGGTNYIRVHCRYRGVWPSSLPVLTASVSGKTYYRY